MDIRNWLHDARWQSILIPAVAAAAGIILMIFLYKKIIQAKEKRKQQKQDALKLKNDNLGLAQELRKRIIDNLNMLSRVINLNPVVAGNTPEDTSLESRNRSKCLSMIVEGLPRDLKGQGVRMAEFIHQLSDYLVHAYGKDGAVNVLIDSQAVILDADSAASVGLMLNELISNALKYAPVPGERSKINIIFKERDKKLFLSVGDNGIGMKSPYVPKFMFGIQLVNTLVQKHKGEMIITSRPGTRVEISLNEYQKAERDVFITPTTKVY